MNRALLAHRPHDCMAGHAQPLRARRHTQAALPSCLPPCLAAWLPARLPAFCNSTAGPPALLLRQHCAQHSHDHAVKPGHWAQAYEDTQQHTRHLPPPVDHIQQLILKQKQGTAQGKTRERLAQQQRSAAHVGGCSACLFCACGRQPLANPSPCPILLPAVCAARTVSLTCCCCCPRPCRPCCKVRCCPAAMLYGVLLRIEEIAAEEATQMNGAEERGRG